MPVSYVPILKGKEGEYAALEELSSGSKDAILPLIEVPNVPFDYANERPAKTLQDHVSGVADRLRRCWTDRDLYIDTPWFAANEHLDDGVVAIARVLGDCLDQGVRAIPVIWSSSSNAHLLAVRQHLPDCGGAFAVRLSDSDFDEDSEGDPAELVGRLLDAVDGDIAHADLILDLGDIGSDVGRATLVARAVLSDSPRVIEWRRVILAASSFPENLAEVSAATTSRLPRVEWQLWQRLQRRRNAQRRDLVFGDYGISHPVPTELDPRVMRMSASIRYTTAEHWLVIKGRNVRQYGFDQYFELARELVGAPEYSGETFSAGDRFIARCARSEVGPGNATTWRKVGTNHHLTLVARELAANADRAALA